MSNHKDNEYYRDLVAFADVVGVNEALDKADELLEESKNPVEKWAADKFIEDYDSDEDEFYDDDIEEDDYASTTDVYGRAHSCFGGNHELAREATELYPGDFI